MRRTFVVSVAAAVMAVTLLTPHAAHAAPPLQLPWLTGDQHRINSGGYSYNCGGHTGSNAFAIDFEFGVGQNVGSAAPGSISIASKGFNQGAGNYLEIDHGGGYRTRYLHLRADVDGGPWPSYITLNLFVSQGGHIAYSGNTGGVDAHLHFDMKLNGAAYMLEPMSGITGFGQYGLCTGLTSSYWTSHSSYQTQASWLLHQNTVLHPTGASWEFAAGDYNHGGRPDVIGVKKQGAPTNRTEVHILSGETNFQSFALQHITGLGPTDGTWQFEFADWNGDAILDLFGIQKQGPNNSTALHIYSGAAPSYFEFALDGIWTGLHATDSTWEFAVVDWDLQGKPDLVGIKKQGGNNSTEVHIYSGESRFQTGIEHTTTPLQFTGSDWTFEAGDYNNDGIRDLFAIDMSIMGTVSTEVHILSGARSGNGHGFQDWLLHTGTPLGYTDRNYWAFAVADWDGNGNNDLFIIKKPGELSTEVHALSG